LLTLFVYSPERGRKRDKFTSHERTRPRFHGLRANILGEEAFDDDLDEWSWPSDTKETAHTEKRRGGVLESPPKKAKGREDDLPKMPDLYLPD